MLTSGLTLAVGLAVLFLGRQLFWLFVGATGFAVGLRWAAESLVGQPEWVVVGVALVIALAGALLAVFLQWVAIALAGFLAGGYATLVATRVLGVTGETWTWLLALGGGLLAAALLLWLWDYVLVALSALVGAALLTPLAPVGREVSALVFVALVVVGVLVQTWLLPPARLRAGAPSGRRP